MQIGNLSAQPAEIVDHKCPETDPVSWLAKIALTVETEWENTNCVGMSESDIKGRWIRLGNHFYSVVKGGVSSGALLLTRRQFRELAEAVFVFEGNDTILASHQNRDFPLTDEATFEIEPLDGNTDPISLTDLQEAVKKHLKEAVISAGRSFILPLDKRRFSIKAVKWGHSQSFCQLRGNCEVHLKSKQFSIYNRNYHIDKEDLLRLSIKSEKLSEFFRRNPFASNLLIEKSQIIEQIKYELKFPFCRGDEFHVDWKGDRLKVKVEKVARAIKKSSENKYGYKKRYILKEKFKYSFSVGSLHPYILFAKGAASAKSMTVEIEKIASDEKPAWLSIEDLKPHLCDKKFVQEQGFKVSDEFYVRVRDFGPSAEKEVYHEFTSSSELEVTAKNGIFIVDTNKSHELSQLKLRVEYAGKKATLSKENLEKEVREFFKESIFAEQKAVLKVKNSDEKRIEVKVFVEQMDFNEKPPAYKYGVIGTLAAATKIEFDLSKSSLAFTGETKEVNLGDLTETVGGLSEEIKGELRRVALSRGSLRDHFERMGVKPVKGMLLWGPPGTGKTTLARSIGKFFGCEEGDRLQLLNGSELTDMYVGETERHIRELFAPAEEAMKKGSKDLYIVVIDEAESVFSARVSGRTDQYRNSWVNQFLGKLDGLKVLDNIFIVLLTNRPEMIDRAVLRPGRIEKHFEISLPGRLGREEIFTIHTKALKKAEMLGEDVDIKALAAETQGYSGAEIEGVVKTASATTLERLLTDQKSVVTMQDFRQARAMKSKFF